MKKFLKNTLLFLISFYGVLIVLVLFSNFLINKNADFKLENNIRSIMIGNSQSECAYNDSLISDFKNLSRSAETYFYSYQKLKKVVEQNPQIENVFIEFNPTNILIREDEKIWGDSYIRHQLTSYLAFLDFKDHVLLFKENPDGYQYVLLKSLYPKFHRILSNEYNYIDSLGGYLYLKRSKINEHLKAAEDQDLSSYRLKESEMSAVDLIYLDKMLDLCIENNIRPFLIRSPYHPRFAANKYEGSFQEILQNRYGAIEFLDFKDFDLNDAEYGDLQHLNYKGAIRYSKWFNEKKELKE